MLNCKGNKHIEAQYTSKIQMHQIEHESHQILKSLQESIRPFIVTAPAYPFCLYVIFSHNTNTAIYSVQASPVEATGFCHGWNRENLSIKTPQVYA